MSTSSEHNTSGYDTKDVNVTVTVVVTVTIIALIVFSIVLLNEYFISLREDVVQTQVLEVKSKILTDLQAIENERLSSYGIADSVNNVYYIPINRAMDLQASEAVNESTGNSR